MKRASRSACWACVLVLGSVWATRARSGEETEVDVVRNLGLPTAVLKMMLNRGWPLSIEVTLEDGQGRPAANRKLTLRWKEESKELETDREGRTTFQVSNEMLPQPLLVIPEGTSATFKTPGMRVSTGTGTRAGIRGMDGTGKMRELKLKTHTLDLSKMGRLQLDGLEVYYPEGTKDLAIEVLAYLSRARGFVRGLAGLDLATPYGLALHDKGILANVTVQGRVVFPLAISAWTGKADVSKEIGGLFPGMGGRGVMRALGGGTNVHWVPIHEWVEGTLVGPGLYMEDKRTRFVGDGLAELLSYEYCRRHHRGDVRSRLQQYLQRADGLLASGQDRYDLGKSFHAHVSMSVQRGTEKPAGKEWKPEGKGMAWMPSPAEAAGYPMSFWFWHQVIERAGPDAIRKIVAWLMRDENPDRNLEGVLKQVEKVAGFRPAIEVDVKQARKGFAHLLEKVR